MSCDPFCLSSCLAFRYVAKAGCKWKPGVIPDFPSASTHPAKRVGTSEEILAGLTEALAPIQGREDVGLLLSGGMDSAILAALLPRGTRAYTIRFLADGAVDETEWAARYAAKSGLPLTVIDVAWNDYEESMDTLMRRKRSPLHAVEVGLYKAACRASADGLRHLIVGNGADSTFGGLDKLLARDWTFSDFAARYSFVHPEDVLVDPISVQNVFEPYRRGDCIDVQSFLKVVHGLGIIQAFENAIGAAHCFMVAPYEELALDGVLDIARIRRGESKYLVRTLFARLYPEFTAPNKIPFARPMDRWLGSWQGPSRPEFRRDLDWSRFNGEQRWILYTLNRFLGLIDGDS